MPVTKVRVGIEQAAPSHSPAGEGDQRAAAFDRPLQQHARDRCAPAGRRRWRSGRRRRRGRGGCGRAPGRRRSGRCRPPSAAPNLLERASGERSPASGRLGCSFRRVPQPQRLVQAVRQHGDAGDAHARGVADRAEDGGRGGDQRRLADALGAVGPLGLAVLDQLDGDLAARRRRWGSGSRAGSRCGRG